MSRSGKRASFATPNGTSSLIRLTTSSGALLTGMALYTVVAFFPLTSEGEILVPVLVVALSKVLGMYVHFGISLLAYQRKLVMLSAGAVGAVAASLVVASTVPTAIIVGQWSMLIVGSGFLGLYLSRRNSALGGYVIGLGIVLVAAAVMVIPQVGEMQIAIGMLGNDLANQLPSSGANTEDVEAMRIILGQLSRFSPGAIIMSFAAWYSVAALLFLALVDRLDPVARRLAPFTHWQVPFWVIAILPVAVAVRFFGQEGLTLATDNALLILSVFYCAAGVSLMSYYLKKLKITLFTKVAVYLLLTLSGPPGYLIICLAGVLDSYFDWRGITQPKEQLEKSIE